MSPCARAFIGVVHIRLSHGCPAPRALWLLHVVGCEHGVFIATGCRPDLQPGM